jgi:hypothetical protein
VYFVVGDVLRILDPPQRDLPTNFEVVSGSRERLIYSHRIKNQRDLYWIVNDTDRARYIARHSRNQNTSGSFQLSADRIRPEPGCLKT